jgi:L-cysteine S-thiosulfotransferase
MKPMALHPNRAQQVPKRLLMRNWLRHALLQASYLAPRRRTWTQVGVVCGALAAPSALAQGSAEQGFRVMAAGGIGNCVVCHSMPGASGPASNFAPSLHQVGTRYNAQQLRQWVTDARLIKPATLMPPFGTTQGTNSPMLAQPVLSAEDINHVVAALQTLR